MAGGSDYEGADKPSQPVWWVKEREQRGDSVRVGDNGLNQSIILMILNIQRAQVATTYTYSVTIQISLSRNDSAGSSKLGLALGFANEKRSSGRSERQNRHFDP